MSPHEAGWLQPIGLFFSALKFNWAKTSDVMQGVGVAPAASSCRKEPKVCSICTAATPAAILDTEVELKRPHERCMFTSTPIGFLNVL